MWQTSLLVINLETLNIYNFMEISYAKDFICEN